MLIDHIFETRIGSLQQRLSVVSVPSNMNSRVSPEQAFLLSRLDGGASVEEVLDLSPLVAPRYAAPAARADARWAGRDR